MAYVFNQIENKLGGGQENDEVKKTEAGSAGPSTSSPMAGQTQAAPKPSEPNKNATLYTQAIKANAGKTQSPAALDSIQSDLTTQNKNLQDSANSFLTTSKANNNYDLSDQDFDKAASGGDANQPYFNKVQGLLGTKNTNVGKFTAAEPNLKDLNLLDNQAGLAQLASRGQAPTYTAGQGAFDAMIMQRDPNFIAKSQNLKKQAFDLKQTSQKTQAETQKAAEDAAAADLAGAQEHAKQYYASQQKQIQDINYGEAQAAQQALDNLNKEHYFDTELNQALPDLQNEVLSRYGERSTPQFQQALDLLKQTGRADSSYIQKRGAYDANEFVSGEEANRFNTIMNLLGQGGTGMVQSGDVAPQYSFDKNALLSKLGLETGNLRTARDSEITKQRDDLLGNYTSQADQLNLANQTAYGNIGTELQDLARGVVGGNADYRQFYDPANPNPEMFEDYLSSLNLSQGPTYRAQDLFAKNDADSLNSIARELGTPDTYQAGSGVNPTDYVNDKAFTDWFSGRLGGMLSNQNIATGASAQAPAVQAAINDVGGFTTSAPILGTANILQNGSSSPVVRTDKLALKTRESGVQAAPVQAAPIQAGGSIGVEDNLRGNIEQYVDLKDPYIADYLKSRLGKNNTPVDPAEYGQFSGFY